MAGLAAKSSQHEATPHLRHNKQNAERSIGRKVFISCDCAGQPKLMNVLKRSTKDSIEEL